jgi:hypothetical protein
MNNSIGISFSLAIQSHVRAHEFAVEKKYLTSGGLSAHFVQNKGEAPETQEVDLTKEMTREQYEAIVQQALDTDEQDAEEYLKKVQARMQR